jgi:DNA-binding FadR family transcriptional regulator
MNRIDISNIAKGDAPEWAPVRATSVASKIVLQIRDALFAGALKPGDALGSEKDLVQQFDVSRITVRDALRTLETMGIVEIRAGAGGGASIAAGNLERISDALAVQFKLSGVTEHETVEAQIAIEGAAVALAAERRTPADLAQLSELLTEAEGLQDDSAKFTESGHRFHTALIRASGNRVLTAQFDALHHAVWPKNSNRATPDIAARALNNHRQLYEAVKNGDGALASELMCRHLEDIRQVEFPNGETGCC